MEQARLTVGLHKYGNERSKLQVIRNGMDVVGINSARTKLSIVADCLTEYAFKWLTW